MNNKQYYSCERNHYFFGKLMTVRDFESEQVYFNSKRRLGNRMLNGAGIVSGLDVLLVDSRTFSLESGIAIDYAGREIVVPEPSVKRLSVIKGFEENKENGDMYLCIEYKESFKESTFSVAGSGKDNGVSEEYNRISEGYNLFLTSKEPDPKHLNLVHLVNKTIPVYNKNGIKLSLEITKYVNPLSSLKVSVIFEKNNVSAPVKYGFDIGGKFFKAANGEPKLHVDYQEAEVSAYKNEKRDYYINCDAVSDALCDIEIDAGSFVIDIGQDRDRISQNIKDSVTVTTRSIRDLIVEEYYSKHFDEIIEEKEDQYIYLAKFHIISNQSTYFIEEIRKNPFNQYLLSNDLLQALSMVSCQPSSSSHTVIEHRSSAPVQQVVQAPVVSNSIPAENIVTGVEKINLGFYPKVGNSYYTYEFVHGLGYGKVGIITAIENKANYLTNNDNVLVFGDGDVFTSEEFTISAPNVEVGAIANPDKGTMKIGVKLLEKTSAQSIDIRWWAFKPSQVEKEEEILIDDNVKVIITPNTTKIKPMDQIRFTAKLEGTSNQEVRWSVTESGAGTIDSNGLYTAPSKEGVYEIKAQSVKFEDKYDSAYVVVSSEE